MIDALISRRELLAHEKFSYLTPVEHLIIGSSDEVPESKERVSYSRLGKLFEDENTRKFMLTPTDTYSGKKTLGQVIEKRTGGKLFSGILNIFGYKEQLGWLKKEIQPVFKPGKLDQNGQLTEFEIFFLNGDGERIEPPEDKELAVIPDFKEVTESLYDEENKVVKFIIKNKTF